MRIAIIPARGGSKRIPRKNIKEFKGQPIIGYAIKAALDSGCFDIVVVSSDDDEIHSIAWAFGAHSHLRSAKNSTDQAGTVPVILEVLTSVEYEHFKRYEQVCCIYPCNPFLTAFDIQYGLMMHTATKADSTFPVVKYGYPPQRALRIEGSRAVMLYPEYYPTRSQDLEPIYHDAGQFYWLNVDALKAQQKLFMKHSTPLITSEMKAQDIDTMEDWTLAEVKYQLWRKSSQSLSSEQEPKAHSVL